MNMESVCVPCAVATIHTVACGCLASTLDCLFACVCVCNASQYTPCIRLSGEHWLAQQQNTLCAISACVYVCTIFICLHCVRVL